MGSAMLTIFDTKESVQKINLEIPTIDGCRVFEKNDLIEDAYKNSLYLKNKKLEKRNNEFSFEKSFLKQIILKRRSSRQFNKQSISKIEFESILDVLNKPIKSDCDEQIDIYCVINRVEGMPVGLIKNTEYIKKGDFVKKAGYLCLEQDLGSFSAVTFFLTSTSNNYQALYQKAGIIGHRLYVASNYLNIGCSGIGAYYDDEVCEFIGEYTQVLYALAIGR